MLDRGTKAKAIGHGQNLPHGAGRVLHGGLEYLRLYILHTTSKLDINS
jgi:hypothetical protein